MTPSQISEMKRIAEAATPGPWHQPKDDVNFVIQTAHITRNFWSICETYHKPKEDAQFIAHFNPALILRLLDDYEKLYSTLHDILSNVSLDWYIQHFSKSEAPTMESSGIAAKIHNLETRDRIRAVFHRARECLA